jgi:hypothetical protein
MMANSGVQPKNKLFETANFSGGTSLLHHVALVQWLHSKPKMIGNAGERFIVE